MSEDKTMKEVKFVEVETTTCGYGLGKGMKYEFEGINHIIEQCILAGWDYKGYVPNIIRGAGEIEKLSLIFEREK